MNNLEQITANRKHCSALMALGIIPAAFLWWLETEESALLSEEDRPAKVKYEVAPVMNPSPGPECIPAWTKAEVDVMIGPGFSPKPDLFTAAQLGNSKLLRPESYPIYFVERMEVFENGADASAAALIYLIEGGHIKTESANKRLQKVFRPFKQ